MDDDSRPWFAKRQFGYGYGPSTWQGWLATALFLVIFVGTGKFASFAFSHYHLPYEWVFAAIALLFVWLGLFLWIVYTHREIG
jgi:hypothetical protein